AMEAARLSPARVTRAKQGTGTPVAAMVGYDGASRTVTLTPSEKLDANATFAATIKGGPGGAKDLAGNPLAADKVWTFTTGSPPTAVIGSPPPALTYK